ncbi:TMEM165/GDT1 family protein [Sphingomonas sp. CJ20]
MEAIVPAFLLAVLTQIGDRPAMLTAILADRYRRPLLVALLAAIAHGTGNALAAVGGSVAAPMLTPNARSLLLALALGFAGGAGLWPMKAPARVARWKLGAVAGPLIGVFALGLGERTQFLTFAIAAGGLPWFAAIGATLGSLGVAFVAAVLGESGWQALPQGAVRTGIALLLLAAAAYIGLGAVGLV